MQMYPQPLRRGDAKTRDEESIIIDALKQQQGNDSPGGVTTSCGPYSADMPNQPSKQDMFVELHVRQDLLQRLRLMVLNHAMELLDTEMILDFESFHTFFETVVVKMGVYQQALYVMSRNPNMSGVVMVNDIAMRWEMTFISLPDNRMPCAFVKAGRCYPAAHTTLCDRRDMPSPKMRKFDYMAEREIDEVINVFLTSLSELRSATMLYDIGDAGEEDIELVYERCDWTVAEQNFIDASRGQQQVGQVVVCTDAPVTQGTACQEHASLRTQLMEKLGDCTLLVRRSARSGFGDHARKSEGQYPVSRVTRNWADISENPDADSLSLYKWSAAMED